MSRTLKLITTSVLLISFLVLEGPRAVHARFSTGSNDVRVSSGAAASLVRHTVLEVAGGIGNVESPLVSRSMSRDFVSASNQVFAPPDSPMREHVLLALGPFWFGRIRRIVSAEPDGH